MSKPTLVTGATGVLGRAIVDELRARGLPLRVGVRNPAKAEGGPDQVVRLDYAEPATFAPALEGVGGVVLAAPPLDPAAPGLLMPFLESAKAAAVEHVVFISAFGANHNDAAPLRLVEKALIASGLPYTILRPNFFMENFSKGFLSGMIAGQSAIFLAAGDGKTSFISVKDIAAVVAQALSRRLTGQEFDLTGPEALDHAQVAALISEAANRPIEYHALTEDQMTGGARATGMPESAIGYLAGLYAAVRSGYTAGIADGVEQVLGRPPMGFRDFAERNVGAWIPHAGGHTAR